ncbi:CinA family nicotinamide mononucleotide deamidase-related protein [Dissulfurirhabdus thermomarina]|uniref:CinA-like protein n=1 Tax=Dissulfurirhabdus thermomarina TaxID=1765737 RepID=A0A6N9TKJ6_DISTH|nr:CinA family nicotinamide mononucleotide deamidase-related protein [Dissulfurirhabdus thermomarina]NDY41792.1 CinA family nicotinamide mononucleotide deamidase-related protein [Dissulfurirhabdus thermomarina]NMX23966.1 CinA family nicotinamide mononucleotide deamidase-related protein [Dissulfurirhabdus thermomarina]
MRGEILAIGDELLAGRVVNTTSSLAAERLLASGHTVTRITTVGDDPAAITECLRGALRRAEFLLVSGGLGPTSDDITNEVVAQALGRPLVCYPDVLDRIRESEAEGGGPIGEKMAWLPEGAEVLNPEGRAAGYVLEHAGVPIFFLPGVPDQLEDHLVHRVLPRLARLDHRRLHVRSRTFRLFGLSETEVNGRLRDREREDPHLSIGYYPNFPEVFVVVTAQGHDAADVARRFGDLCDAVTSLFGEFIVGIDEETLEARVGRLLSERGGRVAVAESCTGGLLASRITRVPGSSGWFDRGIVAYSNAAKVAHLGVAPATLERFGAVSAPVAGEMAEGVRRAAGTGYGLGITGIAGPTGGSRHKPVGTVYISLSTPEKTAAHRFAFPGTRGEIQALAAEAALDWLRRHLEHGSYVPGHRFAAGPAEGA